MEKKIIKNIYDSVDNLKTINFLFYTQFFYVINNKILKNKNFND